mgnify:CR=1 FL=1
MNLKDCILNIYIINLTTPNEKILIKVYEYIIQ